MNFAQAISSGFSNYVNFRGRAVRSEYWYWVLFIFLGMIVAEIIDSVLGLTLIYFLFDLAIILPSIAVGIRRLHDLDRSGWWILLSLIPIVGPIILIIWYCGKGTDGANRFGPDRLDAFSAPISPRARA
jgi:uncharacterized membrane protein YhaH (DUF805 family)